MNKNNLVRSDIEFVVGDKLYVFSIYQNLPKQFGLSIEDAVNNWIVRTDDYTAKSLCKYIMSKNTGYTALTQKQYNKLK